jgi:hypothetical protein
MTGDLAAIYGRRLNLLRMLKSARAPERPYVVFVDDDPAPQLYNFNNSRPHIIGLRTPVAKLGVYADWVSGTTRIAPSTSTWILGTSPRMTIWRRFNLIGSRSSPGGSSCHRRRQTRRRMRRDRER